MYSCTVNFALQEKGIKGYSALYRHPLFNLKRGIVLDELHCLYLGVVLTLLKLWFGKENKGKLFYIGHKV